MKNVLILMLCFLSSLQSIAGNAADLIAEVEKRTLVIVLETTIKAKYDKLDADGQAAYTKAVDNYNRKLKEVAEKFWTVNSKIEFKTWDEVNALIKLGDENCLLLYAGNYSIQNMSVAMLFKGLNFYPEIFSDNDSRNYKDYYTSYKICFIEDLRRDKYIISRSVTNLWPLKEDMVFVFQYIECLLLETKRTNYVMEPQMVANNYKESYASSTLYLRNDIVDNSINDIQLKREYPYMCSTVNRDSLLSAIIEKENVIYVEILPVVITSVDRNKIGFEHVLINSKTGRIVGFLPFNIKQRDVSITYLKKYMHNTSTKNNSYSGEQRE